MVWSSAHAKLHVSLRARVLLPKRSRILIAVSGGQDSLCLAHLLIGLADKWDWSLAIVHGDHQWREDSSENAAHVVRLAEQWNLPAWVEIAESALTGEAAARQWRYRVFAKVARAQGYDYVVTGHTSSDRAETVLYNLIRGTGTDGVGTLPWVRQLDQRNPPVMLVRPLLRFSRQETAAVCQQQQLPVWEDSTNQDVALRRNRIRQELLPYLREHFNPQVDKALSQMAEIAAADTNYLNQQAKILYRRCILEPVDRSDSNPEVTDWTIKRTELSQAPLALQRRVIKQVLQRFQETSALSQPAPYNFFQIEKLIALLKAPNGSRSDPYPGGWIARVNGATVIFERQLSQE